MCLAQRLRQLADLSLQLLLPRRGPRLPGSQLSFPSFEELGLPPPDRLLTDLLPPGSLSDRGAQYTSITLSERLTETGIATSVGAVGSCWYNALAEMINGLDETELIKPRKP